MSSDGDVEEILKTPSNNRDYSLRTRRLVKVKLQPCHRNWASGQTVFERKLYDDIAK